MEGENQPTEEVGKISAENKFLEYGPLSYLPKLFNLSHRLNPLSHLTITGAF